MERVGYAATGFKLERLERTDRSAPPTGPAVLSGEEWNLD